MVGTAVYQVGRSSSSQSKNDPPLNPACRRRCLLPPRRRAAPRPARECGTRAGCSGSGHRGSIAAIRQYFWLTRKDWRELGEPVWGARSFRKCTTTGAISSARARVGTASGGRPAAPVSVKRPAADLPLKLISITWISSRRATARAHESLSAATISARGCRSSGRIRILLASVLD